MSPPSDEPTEAQTAGLNTRREDQDRTLAALQRLEGATGAAAPSPLWHEHARAALIALDEATAEEQRNANEPDSLLSEISRNQPRLRPRVHGIRAQYDQIRDTVRSLLDEVTTTDPDALDIADLRRRTERLASALRYQRSRESDLIYEAYYDTFETELETDRTANT
jgi:DNA repair ATPase RecN